MSASGTRIELRDLRLVREISRYASITRAATALHLSPSAASHRLAKLERNIGAVLFERIGKRMLATRSGQRLIELAEEMLPRVENVEFELRLDRGEPRAPLRVMTSCSSHFSSIATILAECSAADPQMDLQLSLAATEQQFRLLSNNDVDLVITAHPPDNAEVQIAELFSLEVIALAAESHRLAQVAAQHRAVHWNALAGETLLIQNLPHSDVMGLRAAVAMRSQAARSLARHTIVRKVQLFEAIPALARTGRGVGVLCRWKRAPCFDTTGLAILPLVPQWWRRFCAVWRKDNKRQLPLATVVRALQECIGDRPGSPANYRG